MNRILPTLLVASSLVCTSAFAEDISPAVVYDKAGKNDNSFNEAVFNGITRFAKDTGIKVREVEPTNDAQVSQGLSKLAKRKSSPIVAVGFSMANALETAAKEFPDTKFTLIDMVVDLPNVQSVVFTDSNQNYLQPGTMLSSMVKRVGDAAYASFDAAKNGTWKQGVKVMDLKAGGVDWALDEHNRDLVTPAMEKRMGELKALIISGHIKFKYNGFKGRRFQCLIIWLLN